MKKLAKILKNFDIKPKKQLGQNFLINDSISKKIAEIVLSKGNKKILEIGPGLGTITKYFKKFSGLYFAVEYDKNIFLYLTTSFSEKLNINFINADFLKWQESSVFNSSEKVFLFGNIPYSISTPIIKKFLHCLNYENAIFMVQKEYFERLNSKINCKSYGSLSVFVQTFCDLKKIFDVTKKNFNPVPKVDSVVFEICKKSTYEIKNVKDYSQFIKNCFLMKRKTIFNNLKKLVLDQEELKKLLIDLNININKRPETISVFQYVDLYKNFVKKFKN